MTYGAGATPPHLIILRYLRVLLLMGTTPLLVTVGNYATSRYQHMIHLFCIVLKLVCTYAKLHVMMRVSVAILKLKVKLISNTATVALNYLYTCRDRRLSGCQRTKQGYMTREDNYCCVQSQSDAHKVSNSWPAFLKSNEALFVFL